MIFVFGSNLAGRHGAGAAKYAFTHHRAKWGQGIGRQGDSYAIPTKDAQIQTLPLDAILGYVSDFIDYARARPDLEFQVTAIGCGLAGYTVEDIRPMFESSPKNCTWPPEFLDKVERGSMIQAFHAVKLFNSLKMGPIKDENINPTIKKMVDRGYFQIVGGILYMTKPAFAALETFDEQLPFSPFRFESKGIEPS